MPSNSNKHLKIPSEDHFGQENTANLSPEEKQVLDKRLAQCNYKFDPAEFTKHELVVCTDFTYLYHEKTESELTSTYSQILVFLKAFAPVQMLWQDTIGMFKAFGHTEAFDKNELVVMRNWAQAVIKLGKLLHKPPSDRADWKEYAKLMKLCESLLQLV